MGNCPLFSILNAKATIHSHHLLSELTIAAFYCSPYLQSTLYNADIRIFLKCLPELVALFNVSPVLPGKLHSITHKSLCGLTPAHLSTPITSHCSVHTLCSSYTELPIVVLSTQFFHVSIPLCMLFHLPKTLFPILSSIQLIHHLRYVSAR